MACWGWEKRDGGRSFVVLWLDMPATPWVYVQRRGSYAVIVVTNYRFAYISEAIVGHTKR